MSQTAVLAPLPPARDRALAALLSPTLTAAFQPPPGPAGWAHGPFIHWLVQAAAPDRLAVAGRPGRGAAALREAARRLRPQAAWAADRADGTDLLLIESPADAAAAEAILADWTPALSPRATLLLHGAATAGLPARLAGQPHFLFPHGGGLAVIPFGAAAVPVAALCRLDAAERDACRERFALLGRAWEATGDAAELQMLRDELAEMRASTTWRLTAPPRVAIDRLRSAAAQPAAVPPPRAAHRPARAARDSARVLFIAAEPETPGAVYRCARPAAAAAAAGWTAHWRSLDRVTPAQVAASDVVVLWRAAWSEPVEAIIAEARRGGTRVVLDLDDLIADPELARREVIDGIRSAGLDEVAVRRHALRLRRTLAAADALFASTEPLAAHLRQAAPDRPVFVLPNGFDAATHARSRRAARARRLAPADGLLRLGYAAGTPTHQRDFAVAAPAVAALLRRLKRARLVLFETADGRKLLDTAAFPALAGLERQVEWRRSVPLSVLPDELARFDINLVPLETGNPFCEAKSELKYFESALVDVPTIASPTAPLAAAIADERTGLLAAGPADWHAGLQWLAEDPALRRRLAEAAYRDVVVRFGPLLRADAVAAALDAVRGG